MLGAILFTSCATLPSPEVQKILREMELVSALLSKVPESRDVGEVEAAWKQDIHGSCGLSPVKDILKCKKGFGHHRGHEAKLVINTTKQRQTLSVIFKPGAIPAPYALQFLEGLPGYSEKSLRVQARRNNQIEVTFFDGEKLRSSIGPLSQYSVELEHGIYEVTVTAKEGVLLLERKTAPGPLAPMWRFVSEAHGEYADIKGFIAEFYDYFPPEMSKSEFMARWRKVAKSSCVAQSAPGAIRCAGYLPPYEEVQDASADLYVHQDGTTRLSLSISLAAHSLAKKRMEDLLRALPVYGSSLLKSSDQKRRRLLEFPWGSYAIDYERGSGIQTISRFTKCR